MKVTVKDFEAYSYSCGKNGYLRLYTHGEAHNRYWMGEFIHPRGIVSVYMQQDYTRLDFPHSGRVTARCWRRAWGKRTINQLARQFISDILG